jgi:hypothetical protein
MQLILQGRHQSTIVEICKDEEGAYWIRLPHHPELSDTGSLGIKFVARWEKSSGDEERAKREGCNFAKIRVDYTEVNWVSFGNGVPVARTYGE